MRHRRPGGVSRTSHAFGAIVFAAALMLGTLAHAGTSLTAELVTSGLSRPVYLTHAPGDPERVYIVERRVTTSGRIRIFDLATQTLLPAPFLTVSGVGTSDEQGLLCVAFHPAYANNGYFYISYVDLADRLVIKRYTRSANANLADVSSGQTVLIINQPQENNNGGWLAFGPDGYLYIGTGDGGGECDPLNAAQNLDSFLGKMLRIDVSGDGFPLDANRNYIIPTTNPFFGDITVEVQEIWAYGLRNPWRCSFDSETGDLYIADVGENAREELNYQHVSAAGGANYGWNCREGEVCATESGCAAPPGCDCESGALVDPVHTYDHTNGDCAIIGGVVYRGCLHDSLPGTYFFADHCSDRVWSLRVDAGTVTELTDRTAEIAPTGGLDIASISSFGEDFYGDMYICDHDDGEIFRIGPPTCCEDCDDNSQPDACELATGAVEDCNNNGIPDSCDIDSGFSQDCNGNTIPDECDLIDGAPDCNSNNVPDSCDIDSGFSQDCNGNTIPDECDVASGHSEDCNDNLVPDNCDIDAGTSTDNDGNQVPDDCEIVPFTPPQQFQTLDNVIFVTPGNVQGFGGKGRGEFYPLDDVVAVIPGSDLSLPGHVQVLLNNGVDGGGEWLGFTVLPPIEVGRDPRAAALGHFNFDGCVDLVVANAGDDTVSVYVNNCVGDGTFTFLTNITDEVSEPSNVTAADFNFDWLDDIAVTNAGSDTVTIYLTDFGARAGPGFPRNQTVAAPPDPSTIDPEDLDNDKDIDIVISSRSGSSTPLRNNSQSDARLAGTPPLFTGLAALPVGNDPIELAVCDLNWDGDPEIVNAVNDDHLLSILVGNGDLTFEQPIEIGGIGLTPLSVDCDDFDGDGDNDLAVVAEVNDPSRNADGRGAPVRLVQLLLNNTPYESKTLVFAPPINLPVDANANFVSRANLDGNFAFDITTGNSDTASVSALLNRDGCPVDLSGGDGEVTIADVVLALTSFGPCPPPGPTGCPADITPPPAGDGQVSIADVILIIASFGQSCDDDDG